jgi:hypothetical protein
MMSAAMPLPSNLQPIMYQIAQMAPQDQLLILRAVAELLQADQQATDIRTLRGLGREIWKDIQVEDFIQNERDARKQPQ